MSPSSLRILEAKYDGLGRLLPINEGRPRSNRRFFPGMIWESGTGDGFRDDFMARDAVTKPRDGGVNTAAMTR